MLIEQQDNLREWICQALQPLSDAEPDALSKYIMALLKKDYPEEELKRCCTEQLDVFLQQNTETFVTKLFEAINEKSYFNITIETGEKCADGSPPHIKAPPLSSPVKSTADQADKEISSFPSFRPKKSETRSSRIARRKSTSRSRSRSAEKDKTSVGSSLSTRTTRLRDREQEVRPTSRRRSPITAPPKESWKAPEKETKFTGSEGSFRKDKRRRPRCRDYDEKGYCMLGDNCPFDHGPDPVVVEEFPLQSSMFAMGDAPARTVKAAVVAPPPPNFSVPPPGYAAVAPVESKYPSEGYNPEAPSLSSAPTVKGAVGVVQYTRPPPPMLWPHPPPSVLRFPHLPPAGVRLGPGKNAERPLAPGAGFECRPPYGGRRRFGRADNARAAAYDTSNRTLEVRKIPTALNNIAKLNAHFSQYGNVTNINVGFDNDPQGALITYSARSEAVAAYKSTTPIFNNRFIRIFWHNAPEATDNAKAATTEEANETAKETAANKNGTASAVLINEENKMEIASAELSSEKKVEVSGKETTGVEARLDRTNNVRKRSLGSTVHLQRASLELLNKYLDQQKVLFAKLEACHDAERRKQLVEILKQLEKTTIAIKDRVNYMKDSCPGKRSRVEVQKELLDMELELMTRQESGEDMSKLVTKLHHLRTEMKFLQTPEKPTARKTVGHQQAYAQRRPVRISRCAATLDKRPRKVIILKVAADQQDALVNHLNTCGATLEECHFKPAGEGLSDAVVTFKTRKCAEVAFAKGKLFNKQVLNMQWFAEPIAPKSDDSETNTTGKKQLTEIAQLIPATDDS